MLLSTEESSWETKGHNDYGAENKGSVRASK